MEDKEIIQLYFNRNENAIAQTHLKYHRYCTYIANQILHDEKDVEEVLNDVYLKIWNTIPPNNPASLKAYAGMIARQKAINYMEKKNSLKRGYGLCIGTIEEMKDIVPDPSKNFEEDLIFADTLNEFLAHQKAYARIVFVKRYWYMETIDEIAEELGVSASSVKMSLLRSRKKLMKYLREEGYSI